MNSASHDFPTSYNHHPHPEHTLSSSKLPITRTLNLKRNSLYTVFSPLPALHFASGNSTRDKHTQSKQPNLKQHETLIKHHPSFLSQLPIPHSLSSHVFHTLFFSNLNPRPYKQSTLPRPSLHGTQLTRGSGSTRNRCQHRYRSRNLPSTRSSWRKSLSSMPFLLKSFPRNTQNQAPLSRRKSRVHTLKFGIVARYHRYPFYLSY